MKFTLLTLALLQSVTVTWTPSPTTGATASIYRIPAGCPSTVGGGVQLVSGLTTTSFTDATTVPGTTYGYYGIASVNGLNSAPSSCFTAIIPQPPTTLTPTLIGYGTATINSSLTRVTVNVSAVSGKVVPQGTIIWSINGKPIYTDTLLKNGRDGQNVWTLLLNSSIPITITYSGNANFAASSVTLP